MPERQTLHIFETGNYQTFGYTEDRMGANLPTLGESRRWIFHSTIEVQPGEGPRAGMNVDEIQAEIRKTGICIKENVVTVQMFPPQPVIRR